MQKSGANPQPVVNNLGTWMHNALGQQWTRPYIAQHLNLRNINPTKTIQPHPPKPILNLVLDSYAKTLSIPRGSNSSQKTN